MIKAGGAFAPPVCLVHRDKFQRLHAGFQPVLIPAKVHHELSEPGVHSVGVCVSLTPDNVRQELRSCVVEVVEGPVLVFLAPGRIPETQNAVPRCPRDDSLLLSMAENVGTLSLRDWQDHKVQVFRPVLKPLEHGPQTAHDSVHVESGCVLPLKHQTFLRTDRAVEASQPLHSVHQRHLPATVIRVPGGNPESEFIANLTDLDGPVAEGPLSLTPCAVVENNNLTLKPREVRLSEPLFNLRDEVGVLEEAIPFTGDTQHPREPLVTANRAEEPCRMPLHRQFFQCDREAEVEAVGSSFAGHSSVVPCLWSSDLRLVCIAR